jgi:molybdopterin converting factor small subunit
MIRVVLPAHLRTLTQAGGEVELEVAGQVTQRSVLDALEARYPVLRGTIRGHDGGPAGRSSGSSPASRTCRTTPRTNPCPTRSRPAPSPT